MQATASLDALEHQTHVVQAAQEREYYLISAEMTSQNGELQHKAKMLELENCKLQDELAALAVSEQQNRVLRQTLDNVRKTAARDAATIFHKSSISKSQKANSCRRCTQKKFLRCARA